MAAKRILIFSLVYYPRFVGGAEVAIKEITDRINPDDFVFDMVTLRLDRSLPRTERIGNINVHRIGFGKRGITFEQLSRFPWYLLKVWYPVGAYLKARSLHRAWRYDGLWSMMTYMGFPAVLFKKFTDKNIPYILTLQDGDSIEHITGRKRIQVVGSLLRQVFERPTVVQTISTYLAQFAYDMGSRCPIEVVPNGADMTVFARPPNADEIAHARMRTFWKEGEMYLVTTSRLVAKNGLEDVIRALPLLPKHIKFLILGTGPLEAELKDIAGAIGVTDRVIFFGYVESTEIPRYLAIASIFIRPSLSEGMGSSFVEAMAAGIPVIATPVGGITDFLFDPESNPGKVPTGLFVTVHGPDSPDSIAKQVKRLLDDADLRATLIKNGRELALARYDWDGIAKDMQEKVFGKAVL